MIITIQNPVHDPAFSCFITAPPVARNMGFRASDTLSRGLSEVLRGNHD
jgi:hypothetical protein